VIGFWLDLANCSSGDSQKVMSSSSTHYGDIWQRHFADMSDWIGGRNQDVENKAIDYRWFEKKEQRKPLDK
jgi:hypothetical protein